MHGNRARLIGLLEWLRQSDFDVTFILQPLDVEDRRGLDQLAKMVARLEIVRPPARTVTGSLKQAMRSTADALLPGKVTARLRTVARAGRPAPPPVREGSGTAIMSSDGRHIDTWCWPTTCGAVRRAIRTDRPLAVLTEYALLSKCLEDVPPGVLKIIDTVEVFFRNADRFHIAGLEAPVVCTAASEKAALGRADLLVAIQKNDATALQEAFPGKDVVTVPYSFRQPLPRSHGPGEATVLFVGSSNPFNVHGLGQFVQRAWPAILTRVPQATLRIVGSVPPVRGPRIVHVGLVTDEELAREYQRATVVINPQVAGTGLKIKCVEALSAGCPLVTNAAGADGLEDGAGVAYRLASNWSDFTEHVVTLLTDEQARVALETAAAALADRLFSPSTVFAELSAVLGRDREGGAHS